MPFVVKIKVDDRGERRKFAKWCYVHEVAGGNTAFCTGEYFGIGESGCIYETKVGKITCPKCLSIIKTIKKVKL